MAFQRSAYEKCNLWYYIMKELSDIMVLNFFDANFHFPAAQLLGYKGEMIFWATIIKDVFDPANIQPLRRNIYRQHRQVCPSIISCKKKNIFEYHRIFFNMDMIT